MASTDAIMDKLRSYVNDFITPYSFNALVAKAALQYLEETAFTSFNDLVRRAANKYTGVNKVALNDALVLALSLYTGRESSSLSDLVNAAALLTNTPNNYFTFAGRVFTFAGQTFTYGAAA